MHSVFIYAGNILVTISKIGSTREKRLISHGYKVRREQNIISRQGITPTCWKEKKRLWDAWR